MTPPTGQTAEPTSTVTMYSTQWCGYCHRLRSQLDREGIAYEVVDIEREPDAALVVLGVLVSTMILAGGTANFLLYRRAAAAMRVVGARAPGGDANLAILRKVGGTSWRAVGVGLLVTVLLRAIAASAAP